MAGAERTTKGRPPPWEKPHHKPGRAPDQPAANCKRHGDEDDGCDDRKTNAGLMGLLSQGTAGHHNRTRGRPSRLVVEWNDGVAGRGLVLILNR